MASRQPQAIDIGRKAYYLVFAPPGSSLAELVAVAGLRWAIEECFARAKDDLLIIARLGPGTDGIAI